MADDRTYIRVHDGMDEHPKIEGLSDAAFRALHRCWYYASRQKTDGRLTDVTWNNRAKTPKVRSELVDAGLVHLAGVDCPHEHCPTPAPAGHVQMHDYLDHQRSAQAIEDLKEKRRAAGKLGGRPRGSKTKANANQDAKQTPKLNESKKNPDTEADTDTEKEPLVTSWGRVTEVDAHDPQPPTPLEDLDEPPLCTRHTGWDRDAIPGCRACGRLREQWATAVAEAAKPTPLPPLCGQCDNRWIQPDDNGPAYRCPRCHPRALGATA